MRSEPQRRLPVQAVLAIAVVPVVAAVWFLAMLGARPGAFGTVLILVMWAGMCTLLIPWLERRRSRREAPLGDPATYSTELQELTQSRREIVQAFEIERRRIERDLHDGAQQYIVAASMQVGEASMLLDGVREGQADPRLASVAELLSKAQDTTDEALTELRRTVAGIHPKVLSDMGLEAAVRDIAARSSLDVTVRVPHPLPQMPEGVVASAYFLVSEALTNVAKYARDAEVTVLLAADNDLHVSVVDSGPGGARLQAGHGLMGMRERLRTFGGTLELSSPPGGPTTVSTRIPLLLLEGESSVVIPLEEES